MTNELPYKVKIEGPGLNLEKEVSAAVGEQVVVLLVTGQAVGGGRHNMTGAQLGETGKRDGARIVVGPGQGDGSPNMSIREYMNECLAQRIPDKIAAIGAFLRKHRGQQSFTRSDLEIMFEEAAEPIPRNMPRDIKWAVRVGWVAQKSGDKGVYYVTHPGMNAVQNRFPGEMVKKTSQNPSRKRRSHGKDGEQ